MVSPRRNEENDSVVISRETRESKITVHIERGVRRAFKIETGLEFLNHMIETIAWRACINIDVKYANLQYCLSHLITEDIGIAMGKAFRTLLERVMETGVDGCGSKIGIIDDGMAIVAVSFEGRSNTFIDANSSLGAKSERVEDMLSQDLPEFFKGFSQGAGASINIKILSGKNPHHTWEAVFRAFGEALRECFKENQWRRKTTPGVKGTLV